MLTVDGGASCLYISAMNGHLEVVNALLEAGGRELVMMIRNDGVSCLHINAQNGHLKVVKRAAGGRGARASDADYGQWSQLPVCRSPEKPRGGLQGAGDGVPECRLVSARDHDSEAWLDL